MGKISNDSPGRQVDLDILMMGASSSTPIPVPIIDDASHPVDLDPDRPLRFITNTDLAKCLSDLTRDLQHCKQTFNPSQIGTIAMNLCDTTYTRFGGAITGSLSKEAKREIQDVSCLELKRFLKPVPAELQPAKGNRKFLRVSWLEPAFAYLSSILSGNNAVIWESLGATVLAGASILVLTRQRGTAGQSRHASIAGLLMYPKSRLA